MDLFKQNIIICVLTGIILISCNPTANKTETKVNIPQLMVKKNRKLSVDKNIGVFKSAILRDTLTIQFGNRNSCGPSDKYQIITDLSYNKSNPPQLRCALENDIKTEGCSKDTVITMKFMLTELKNKLVEEELNFSRIVLNINGKNCGVVQFKNK